ncbi:Hypothetical protein PHPALM_37304 [Phytophthora palmivora]|uniref:Uncharacterized protein n=1 Tax=Phytophthora palmivora TaxID=4796 RepID=A0A2P4WXR7_9STRA|nr:Hypothetical protein PHPALM_37304 [Phytophthora palmivora]
MARQRSQAPSKKKRLVSRKVTVESSGIASQLQALSLPAQNDQTQLRDIRERTQIVTLEPVSRPKKPRGSKTIKIYKGFPILTSRISGCKAVLKVTPTAEWRVEGDHNCRRGLVVNGNLADERNAMKRMTDRLATENPGMPEGDIWEQVCGAFYGPTREEQLEGLTEEQVIGRIRRVRRRYYGGDIHGVVEVPPCSKVKDSIIPFFRFHLVTADPDPKARPNRILGWAHPALKELLL